MKVYLDDSANANNAKRTHRVGAKKGHRAFFFDASVVPRWIVNRPTPGMDTGRLRPKQRQPRRRLDPTRLEVLVDLRFTSVHRVVDWFRQRCASLNIKSPFAILKCVVLLEANL